jgi:hypothetical protein
MLRIAVRERQNPMPSISRREVAVTVSQGFGPFGVSGISEMDRRNTTWARWSHHVTEKTLLPANGSMVFRPAGLRPSLGIPPFGESLIKKITGMLLVATISLSFAVEEPADSRIKTVYGPSKGALVSNRRDLLVRGMAESSFQQIPRNASKRP